MNAPRIVTPQEAQRVLDEQDERIGWLRLAHTVVTEPERIAAAERAACQEIERQLAAAVDELTDAQQENARLAALIVEAYDQRDAAQEALQQADERQRQAERAAAYTALQNYALGCCNKDWSAAYDRADEIKNGGAW